MEPITLVTIVISITLASVLVLIGIQIYFILKEVRVSVQKVNKMLDDSGKITGTVSAGVENAAGFVNGIKAGISAISAFKKNK